MTITPNHPRDERFAVLRPRLSARPAPDATVQPAKMTSDLLFLSGQVAFAGDELLAVGRLGAEVDVELGMRCARQCAVNLLGRVQEELGSLGRVHQTIKLTVFVASAGGFREQHLVANGASEVFSHVLDAAGSHARSAVGVAELPLGTPVEVEAILAFGGA